MSRDRTPLPLQTEGDAFSHGSLAFPQREGIVAFIDALGIKGAAAREDPGVLVRGWSELLVALQNRAKSEGIFIAAFSDTIIAYKESEHIYSSRSPIPEIARMASALFWDGLSKGIFLRGAISMGRFHQGSSMLIGPAVDDAAEWYEAANWMGVMLTPRTSYLVDKLHSRGEVPEVGVLRKFPVPIKDGVAEELWAVAWPILPVNKNSRPVEATIVGLDERRARVLEAFSMYPLGRRDVDKYRNTLRFFDIFATSEK